MEIFNETVTQQDIIAYKEIVSTFCYFIGQIYGFAEKARTGLPINEERLSYALNAVENFKPKLLLMKEHMGFNDGLDFLEDNGFLGFRVIEGRFLGDKAAVKELIFPWVKGFPETSNHYQFEVSCHVYFMAEPDRIDLYPETLKEKKLAGNKKDAKTNIDEFFYHLRKRRALWKRKRLRSA